MGMFDYVRFTMDCPGCGMPVNSFQSKDGECVLEPVEPEQVSNFYSQCGVCHLWIELDRKVESHDTWRLRTTRGDLRDLELVGEKPLREWRKP